MNKKKTVTIDNKENFEIEQDTLDYANTLDLDDNQLLKIKRFNNLEQYQKDILTMYSQGMSLRDIGTALNISYGWVKIRLDEIHKILNLKP